jgi:quercetin dioxygenase-like cupin family protein
MRRDMTRSYPYTIDNGSGELLTFVGLVGTESGDRLEVKGSAQPGAGPPMHVHHLQEEVLTVAAGRVGYQSPGGEPRYAGAGETVMFPAGAAHRWWNAGTEPVQFTGWMKPPLNGEYFLTAIFDSMKRSGRHQPSPFDAAFLLTRYKSEFDMLVIPTLVKRLGFPLLIALGTILGKYRRFADAPEPVPDR